MPPDSERAGRDFIAGSQVLAETKAAPVVPMYYVPMYYKDFNLTLAAVGVDAYHGSRPTRSWVVNSE